MSDKKMERSKRRAKTRAKPKMPVIVQNRKRIEVGTRFYDRWERVGVLEGLKTDTQIMRFLIQSYENQREMTSCCVRCQTPLTLFCTKCHLPANQTLEMQKAADAARLRLAAIRAGKTESSLVKMEPEEGSNAVTNNQADGENAAGESADGFRLDDPDDQSDDDEGEDNTDADPDYQPDVVAESSAASENVKDGQTTQAGKEDSSPENDASQGSCLVENAAPLDGGELLSGVSLAEVEAANAGNSLGVSETSAPDDVKEAVEKAVAEFTSTVRLPSNQPLGLPKKRYDRRGDKPSVCSICDQVFPNRPAMKAHRLAEHSVERPYQCHLCPAAFKVKKHRKDHMLSHTGEKPFLCTVCGQGFSFHCGLKTHMRTHTKERPYVCKQCGAAFMQSCNLKVHLRTHTGERPFVCTVCGFAFTTSSHLMRHMATHGDERKFSCQECGRAFKTQACMKAHERTHKGEKPAQCPVCGARFANFAYIKVHMRSHTGERPYVCDICNASFKESGKLTKHRRQNHAIAGRPPSDLNYHTTVGRPPSIYHQPVSRPPIQPVQPVQPVQQPPQQAIQIQHSV